MAEIINQHVEYAESRLSEEIRNGDIDGAAAYWRARLDEAKSIRNALEGSGNA